MNLTETDKATGLHAKLVEDYQARLQQLRVRLEMSQSELSTEKTRGKIEEVKRLLKCLTDNQADAEVLPVHRFSSV